MFSKTNLMNYWKETLTGLTEVIEILLILQITGSIFLLFLHSSTDIQQSHRENLLKGKKNRRLV